MKEPTVACCRRIERPEWNLWPEGKGEGGMNQMPSVTEGLRPFQDFSRVSPERLEAAAARGSGVHQVCAAIAKGLWWASEIPEDQRGYVKSFEKWMDAAVAQVLLVEQRLDCACYGYTGQPDLVVMFKGDDGATVVDLKSPVIEGPTWKGQLAAYNHLVQCNGQAVQRQGALMLSPKGKMANLKEYHSKEDFSAFLSALTAFRYFTKQKE